MTTVLQAFDGNVFRGHSNLSLMRIDKPQSCSNRSRCEEWTLVGSVSAKSEGKKPDMEPFWSQRALTNGSHTDAKSTVVRRKSSSSVDFLQSSGYRDRVTKRGCVAKEDSSALNSSNIPMLARGNAIPKSLDVGKQLDDEFTGGTPVRRVGSLTSSPKWSRIKRTFERQAVEERARITDSFQKNLSRSSNSLEQQNSTKCLVEKDFDIGNGPLMKSKSLPSCGVLQLHYSQNSSFAQQTILKPSTILKDCKTSENVKSSLVKPSSLVSRSQSFKQNNVLECANKLSSANHEVCEKGIVSAKQQATALYKNKFAPRIANESNCSFKNKTSLSVETGINAESSVVENTRRLYMASECATLVKNTSTSIVKSALSLGCAESRKSTFNTNIPTVRQCMGQRENVCTSFQQKCVSQIRIDESLHVNKSGWKQLPSGAWVKANDAVSDVVAASCLKSSKVALLAQKFNKLSTSEDQENVVQDTESLSKPNHIRKPQNQKTNFLVQNGVGFRTSSNTNISNQNKQFVNGLEHNNVCRRNNVEDCEERTVFADTFQSGSGRKISLVQQVVQNFEEHCQLNISDNEVVIQFEKESHSSKESWCSLQSKVPSSSSKIGNSLNKSRFETTSDKRSLYEQHKRPTPAGRKPSIPASVFAKKRQGIVSDGGEDLANQIAGDELISSVEEWFETKCHSTSDTNPSMKPNSSFLWRQLGPRLSGESTDSETTGYYSVPFQHLQKFQQEEHIYMDATLLRNSPGSQRKGLSHDNSDNHGSSCESDEGWVDMSDAEIDLSCSDLHKSVNYLGVQLRPRSRASKGDSSRRSWSQSLRDLASAVDTDTEEWECNDYQDISVWESGDTSSSSTNSDHIYEALYDVILEDREQDLDECDETESNERPNSGDTGIDSGPASTTSTQMSEDKENGVGEEKSDGAKTEGLKRNWSLTKSDIRLELSSKLNKIKIRKNFRSTTDIGVGVQVQPSTSPLPESKKKTLIKFILRQKSSTAAPIVQKKRNKKGATFYVRWSVVDKNTRGRSQSESALVEATRNDSPIMHRQMSEGASRMFDEDSKPVVTVKRRPSGAGAIKRPTSPPPAPPVSAVNGVRSRAGTKSLELISPRTVLSRTDSNKSRSLDVERVSGFNCCDGRQLSNTLDNANLPAEKNIFNSNLTTPHSRFSVASKSSAGSYIPADEVASIPKPTLLFLRSETDDDEINYLQLQTEPHETLKSPFEEEPLYQFYQKHVSQQATMWHTMNRVEELSENGETATQDREENSEPQGMHPTAMDLLHHSRAGHRTLWCEVPEVIKSGIFDKISAQERKLQEAMFEVITSEASYLKSLNVLVEHFMKRPEFSDDFSLNCVLERRERHVLFSDVLPVRDVSVRLLADLEKRWQENIYINNICDILHEHATKFFSVYVRYCSNQVYQERKLKELKTTRPDFVDVLQRVEANPICQGLDMHSFLMLPMQRVTRMPLLVDAIFHRLPVDSPHYDICKVTLAQLNKVVWECNEGARKMERMEEMLLISRQLDFKDSKSIALISASRWLVKRGELTRIAFDVFAKRTFGRSGRCSKTSVYLFLFTDLLLVAKKKSEDSYTVLDYCPRNMVQVFTIEDSGLPLPVKLPENVKNLFQLTMLQNSEGKTVEMILSCPLQSDKTRWMEAVTPPKSENPDEKIYEEWDCPQVQCIFSYNAQQPDELSLDESDVVNVFRKMSDGWYEGERLRDGVRGWFPASYTVEIISSHIRARNLRQRYRLLVLSHAYLEEQRKACLTQCAKSK